MDERPFHPEPAARTPAPTPTDCPNCGEPAGETIPAACPSCGTPRLATLRFMDPQTFERARAVLHDHGLIVHDRHPNRGYQGMGALFLGTQQPPGIIWIPAERRDDAEAALDEAGLPVPTSGRPIVDQSEPFCPECGRKLDATADPDQGGQCPACGTEFDWIDIEAEAIAAGESDPDQTEAADAGDRSTDGPADMPADPARRDDGPAALDPFPTDRGRSESAPASRNSGLGRLIAAIRPALLIGAVAAGFVGWGQGSGKAWMTAGVLLGLWGLSLLVGPPILEDSQRRDGGGGQSK